MYIRMHVSFPVSMCVCIPICAYLWVVSVWSVSVRKTATLSHVSKEKIHLETLQRSTLRCTFPCLAILNTEGNL